MFGKNKHIQISFEIKETKKVIPLMSVLDSVWFKQDGRESGQWEIIAVEVIVASIQLISTVFFI